MILKSVNCTITFNSLESPYYQNVFFSVSLAYYWPLTKQACVFNAVIWYWNSSGYAEMQGADEGTQATLVSTIGITNTLGRIICGWISDHPKVRNFKRYD